jgi:hypothetical protein
METMMDLNPKLVLKIQIKIVCVFLVKARLRVVTIYPLKILVLLLLANKVQLVQRGHLGLKDHKGHQVLLEKEDHQDQKEKRVILVLPDRRDQKETKDPRGL